MIARAINEQLVNALKPSRVVLLFGARRTGKTVLLHSIADEISEGRVLKVNGENLDVAEILSSHRLSLLDTFVKGIDYLFIDEAQTIPDIGANLKLLTDTYSGLSIFATGSFAFDLRNKTGEPLVGRSQVYRLFPFSVTELNNDFLSFKTSLPERLIYGSYPEVLTAGSEPQMAELLNAIRDAYLLKDILALDNLKDSRFVISLLRYLAYQIGNDVSSHELAKNLGVNRLTIHRYLDLLEKSYIIFSLGAFSRNLRNEISRSSRYYFWDNGIRNSIISNFNQLNIRNDLGQLWENYFISEKLKRSFYLKEDATFYFWRTYDQKEIDLIEEKSGNLTAIEIKYSKSAVKCPESFRQAYSEAKFLVANRDNAFDMLKH
jgi:uncharacterized protein